MANNALAPNIDNVLSDYVYAGRKLKEQRINNLLNPQVKTAMTLADLQALKGAPTQRTPTLGERVEGLSYAAGEGFKDQLEGFKQMLTTNPKDTLMAMYEGLKHVVQDPSILADMGKQAVSSPENFTRFLAQNLNPMDLANVLNKVGTMRELTVYHGTPHTLPPTANNPLGEFDASKIGTGEGAQAYGHGIYVAESPDVAKQYSKDRSYVGKFLNNDSQNIIWDAKRIAQEALDVHGKDAESHLGKVLKANSRSKNPDQLLANKEIENAIQLIKNNEITKKGNLYTVDLPDEKIDQMLDWDKPISQQPIDAQKVLREMWGRTTKSFQQIDPNADPTISQLHYLYSQHKGGNSVAVAQELKAAGIPGIKYLDSGSRGTGAGARNFVVFPGEEKSLKILKRE